MLDRNSDFARLAFSAAPFAWVKVCSTCRRSVRSRVNFANPRAFPAESRMAVKTTFAQKNRAVLAHPPSLNLVSSLGRCRVEVTLRRAAREVRGGVKPG